MWTKADLLVDSNAPIKCRTSLTRAGFLYLIYLLNTGTYLLLKIKFFSASLFKNNIAFLRLLGVIFFKSESISEWSKKSYGLRPLNNFILSFLISASEIKGILVVNNL